MRITKHGKPDGRCLMGGIRNRAKRKDEVSKLVHLQPGITQKELQEAVECCAQLIKKICDRRSKTYMAAW